MTYNLTNLSSQVNESGLLGLTQGVNDTLMAGWFGTLILIGIGIVMLTSLIFSTNDVKRSFAATFFISLILCIFLRAVNLVPDLVLFITLVLTAISLAFAWKNG